MRDQGDPPSGDGADPAVLAGRIEQLARSGEAAFMPVAVQLQEPLQSLLGADTSPLLRALQDMHHAVGDAQCRDPLPPWLRWLGPTRNSGLRFQSDCREAIALRPRILERVQRIAQTHLPRAADCGTNLDRLLDAADRLGGAVDEAQALLAVLWERLRPRRPDPADPGSLATLRSLLTAVDVQRALLERLELACTTARDVARLGRAVLAGRAELLRLVDGRFARACDDWWARVEPLLREGLQPAQLFAGASDATAARRGLLLALDQLRATCTRLQIDEQALALALGQLREQLVALLPPESQGRTGQGADPCGNRSAG
jgi:hypothetical protein